MKYACIARSRREYPVRLMCALLHVSRAGYYAAQHRPLSARARATQRLRVKIRAIYAAHHRRSGAPKVHAELRAQGERCGRHRVARLMRAEQLCARAPRRFRITTQSRHAHPIAPNHLARRFHPTHWVARDRVWVADITYLPTEEGWLYLAVVLDLASRRVIGWCADARLEHGLTLRALHQALTLRQPAPGLLHHSDRGVQYASGAYQALLRQHRIISSMSRRGNCWDNAVVESFFATLKTELVAGVSWPTRAALQRHLVSYINIWYNHQRRHATLGYRSPIQYERDLAVLRRS